MDHKTPSFLTRVDELLIRYGVTMGVLNSLLDVRDCIFPFSLNLGREVSKRSVGLSGGDIPGISSAGVF